MKFEQFADGSEVFYTYGNPGLDSPTLVNRLSRDLSEVQNTIYVYELNGRLDNVTAADGTVTKYTYTPNDQVATTRIYNPGEAGEVHTHQEFDDLGRLTKQFVQDGTIEYADAYVLNPDGSIKTHTRGEGTEASATSYTYYNNGQVKTLTDSENNTTTWTYYPSGQVKTETNENGDTRSYNYDANRRLVRRENRDGLAMEWEYDALGNVLLEEWFSEAGSLVHSVHYDYDDAGQLTTVYDSDASIVQFRDGFGRLVSESGTVEDGFNGVSTLTFLYNEFGERETRTLGTTADDTFGFSDTFDYDKFGRLETISRDNNLGGGLAVSFAYDDVGRLKTVTRGVADLGTVHNIAQTTYDYDGGGRLDLIDHEFLTDPSHTPGVPSLSYDYSYYGDTPLLHTMQSAPDGLTTFTYDTKKQITGVDSTIIPQPSVYNYDTNGNRDSVVQDGAPTSYATDPNNELQSSGQYDYLYNKEGARTIRGLPGQVSPGTEVCYDESFCEYTSATNGEEYREYHWDHRGRLTDIVEYVSWDTEAKHVTYTYDPFDRRVAKTVVDYDDGYGSDYGSGGPGGSGDPAASGDLAERYVYDGAHLLAVLNSAGHISEQILHGPMVDMVLAEEHFDTSTGQRETVTFAVADHQGTVRHALQWDDALDQITGENHIQYDVFGVEVDQTNEDVQLRFGYTGRDRDPENDLYNYRARYYDPATGRFISKDPIGFAAGDANLYRYVGNGPTNATDPSGLAELHYGESYNLGHFYADRSSGYLAEHYEPRQIRAMEMMFVYEAAGAETRAKLWTRFREDGLDRVPIDLGPLHGELSWAFGEETGGIITRLRSLRSKRLWVEDPAITSIHPEFYVAGVGAGVYRAAVTSGLRGIAAEAIAESADTLTGGPVSILAAGRSLLRAPNRVASLESKLAARTMTRDEWAAYSRLQRIGDQGVAAKAEQVLGDYVARIPISERGSVATAVAAYNRQNGLIAIGTNGNIPSRIALPLSRAAENVGGVGHTFSVLQHNGRTYSLTVGRCAEFHAGNQLLLRTPGSTLSDIGFTNAVRPRTGEVIAPCINCEQMYWLPYLIGH